MPHWLSVGVSLDYRRHVSLTRRPPTACPSYKTPRSDNTCVHFGAAFAPDVEDAGLMKCTLHQAKLNPATMSECRPRHP